MLRSALVHCPSPQWPAFERDDRRDMRPGLDVPGLARECQLVEVGFVIGAESGEQGQVVASLEDVDGIDLKEPEALDGEVQLTGTRVSYAGTTEPLCRERDAPRLSVRDRLDHRVRL